MKDKELYAYLGKCIQKYRYPHFNQYELSHNVCTRYTLSKIESGTITANEYILTNLLKKLGLHHKNVVDTYIMQALIKHIMQLIEHQRSTQLQSSLSQMHTLLKRNKNNILFFDYMILHRFLHTHYISKTSIHLQKYDFNTLSFLSDAHYSVLIHTYCENLIQYQSLLQFKRFYHTLPKQEGSVLLDFFKALDAHLENDSEKTFALFMKNREALQKDRKIKQLVRFGGVVCLQQLNTHQKQAQKNIRKMIRYIPKCEFDNQYVYFIYFAITCIYIKEQKYHKAYVTLHNYCIKNHNLMHHSLPYLLFLSYHCALVFDPSPYPQKDTLACACVHYHQFRNPKHSGASHITYLVKHVLEALIDYPYHDCLLTLIMLEKESQFARRTCNKANEQFLKKLKEVIK